VEQLRRQSLQALVSFDHFSIWAATFAQDLRFIRADTATGFTIFEHRRPGARV
jgi:hypothetical protein